MKNQTYKYTWGFLFFLILVLGFLSFFLFTNITQVQQSTQNLKSVEYLSSSTQRYIKLFLEDRTSDTLYFYIDNTVTNALIDESISFYTDDEDFLQMIDNMITDWQDIKEIVNETEVDTKRLFFVGERHFYNASEVSVLINNYVTSTTELLIIVGTLFLLDLFIIALILIRIIAKRNLYITQLELSQHQELMKKSYFDAATGLYNRSKCQELLTTRITPKQNTCIVIFDLNHLKITNDTLGHSVGDELIATFATILKESSLIHNDEPFLGRYGGDEFFVYYKNISEAELSLFLKEVALHTATANLRQTSYKISYAIGYAINSQSKEYTVVQNLFDAADKAMYAHKQFQKKERLAKSNTIK